MTASFLHAQIDSCEKVYLGIFTFELLTKVLAYGFLWHPEAYLRDAWCQLDFVVVTLAWAPVLFPAMGNYSVIRSFRALRPLRALKRMPGMPKLAAAACWKRRPAPSLASAQPGLRGLCGPGGGPWSRAPGGTGLSAGAHGPHGAHRQEGRPRCGSQPGPRPPTSWRGPWHAGKLCAQVHPQALQRGDALRLLLPCLRHRQPRALQPTVAQAATYAPKPQPTHEPLQPCAPRRASRSSRAVSTTAAPSRGR